jgi:hypothetical protein
VINSAVFRLGFGIQSDFPISALTFGVSMSALGLRLRIALLMMIAVAATIGLFLHAPIPQPADYHFFADQEMLLGIPNFWNVFSNAPFLLVGGWGLFVLARRPQPGLLPPLRGAYFCLFAGTLLVGFGSAYYHLDPNNSTLVGDRLPMAIIFMALLSIVIGEYINVKWGSRLLTPLLILGISSVVYWALTETSGQGDLRPYLLVQFLTLLVIFLILLLFHPAFRPVAFFWIALGTYGIAKVFELLDFPILQTLGMVSGHTLKHLLAALSLCFLVLALTHRRIAAPPSTA